MQKIGNYNVIEKIGHGGMGAVYLGLEEGTNKKVAIKVIKTTLSSDDKVNQRFRHEIELSKSLAHPFVIKILDGGLIGNGLLYLVMEFLEGQSLESMYSQKTISVGMCKRAFIHMAEALSYIHSKNIIHRDIKPGNIQIVSKDRTVLLDFGLALGNELTRISKTSDRPGTIATMSPEQLSGKELDGRSDIFSLGVTMYWILTGTPPYTINTLVEMVTGNSYSAPKAPHELNNKIDKRFSLILLKCLAPDKSLRYASADNLVKALQNKGPIPENDTSAERILSMEGSIESGKYSSSSVNTRSGSGNTRSGSVNTRSGSGNTRSGSGNRSSGSGSRSSGSGSRSSRSVNRSSSSVNVSSMKNSSLASNPMNSSVHRPGRARKLGIAFFIIAIVLTGMYYAIRRNPSQGPVIFASKVVYTGPFSIRIEVETPIHSIAYGELTQGEKVTRVPVPEALRTSSSDEIHPWQMTFEGLKPGTGYSYRLFDNTGGHSFQKPCRTTDFGESLKVTSAGAIAISGTFTAAADLNGTLAIRVFLVDVKSGTREEFLSDTRLVNATKGETVVVPVGGLKSNSEYDISLTFIQEDTTESGKALNLKVTTPEVKEKNFKGTIRTHMVENPFTSLLPGADVGWGKGMQAYSAEQVNDNSIYYSYDAVALFKFSLKERKVAYVVKTPGLQNRGLTVSGNHLLLVQSTFIPLDSDNPGGQMDQKRPPSTVFLKSFDCKTLAQENSFPLPENISPDYLGIYEDIAILYSTDEEESAPGKDSPSIGFFYGYSWNTGKRVWKSKDTAKKTALCITGSGTLLAVKPGHILTGINCKTGKEVFSLQLRNNLEHESLSNGQCAYVFQKEGLVSIVDLSTGKMVSEYATAISIDKALLDSGKLYCISNGEKFIDKASNKNVPGTVLALDVSNPSKIRKLYSVRKNDFGDPRGKCLISGRYLYYTDGLYRLNCFDTIHGRFLYSITCNRNKRFNLFRTPTGLIYCHSALHLGEFIDR